MILSDLLSRVPADAISPHKRSGKWLTCTYETADGIRGVMLYGLPHLEPPPIDIDLDVAGWHAIHLGVLYPPPAQGRQRGVLWARLSDDARFSHIADETFRPEKDGHYPEKDFGRFDVCEAYWKSADLTGQRLVLSRPRPGLLDSHVSGLAYVRLEPMGPDEISAWQRQQPTVATRTMVGYETGFFEWSYADSQESFRQKFAHFAQTDFDIVLHRVASGGITYYPSNVGRFAPPATPWEQRLHRCVERGIDPLAEARDAAQEMGVRLFAQNRLLGLQLPPGHDNRHYGGPLCARSEFLCRYSDGEPVGRPSLAFAEVRDFIADLAAEWAQDYQVDGICIAFNRSWPFALYEQPVIDRFRERHGEDARDLSADDQRLCQVRADFVTQLLRQVRDRLDEIGRRQGRYIPVCYPVFVPCPTATARAQNPLLALLALGLDVRAWIAGGLVDYLLLHMETSGRHDGTRASGAIAAFKELCAVGTTEVVADIYPRRMPGPQYCRIAAEYYRAGADRLAIFDTHYRYMRASEWAAVRRLGHRLELDHIRQASAGYFGVRHITRLNGLLTDREYSIPSDG